MNRNIEKMANPDVLPVRPYQPGRSVSAIKKEFGLREVVKLASNENAAGPSLHALHAIETALSEIHYYPDDAGAELKEALAEKHGVERDGVLLGHGATDILDMISRVFICPGDEVISAQPSFPWFQILGQLRGGRNVAVPLSNHRHDLNAMLDRVTPRTKLIFIANPNNPTGTLLGTLELESFFRSVPDDVVVVLDEAYIEYASAEDFDAIRRFPGKPVITVRTFSKISGLAGLRIGYAIGDPDVIGLLEKARQPFNTTALAHVAALASLRDREHVERSRWMVLQGKNYLYEEFGKLGIDYVPTEANFIFVDFHHDAEEIIGALLARGFIIRPALKTCARITIGSPAQNASLVAALRLALPQTSRREKDREPFTSHL